MDVYFDKAQNGRWQLAAKASHTIATDDKVEPVAAALKLVEPYDRETNNWLGRVTG